MPENNNFETYENNIETIPQHQEEPTYYEFNKAEELPTPEEAKEIIPVKEDDKNKGLVGVIVVGALAAYGAKKLVQKGVETGKKGWTKLKSWNADRKEKSKAKEEKSNDGSTVDAEFEVIK